MMKIGVFIFDATIIGGGITVGIDLINELSKFYPVSLLSAKETGEKVVFPLNEEVKYISLYGKRNIRYRTILTKGIFKLRKILLQNEIDVLIIIGMGYAVLPILSTVHTPIKLIVSEQSCLNNVFYQNRIKNYGQKLATRYAKKIITLTKKDKLCYMNKFSLSNDRVEFIHNYISDTMMENKQNILYDITSKRIISVGRFDKVKGFERVVEIGKSLFVSYPNWCWDIWGTGNEEVKKELENLIVENNLENNIFIKDGTQNVLKKYCEYSFYVLTSHHEGFPLTLLEAQVNELPTIAFDCDCGPSDIIEDKINGYLVPQGNLKGMESRIIELIEAPEKRKSFSNNTSNVFKRFKKEDILSKWLNVVKEVERMK